MPVVNNTTMSVIMKTFIITRIIPTFRILYKTPYFLLDSFHEIINKRNSNRNCEQQYKKIMPE